MSARVKRRRTAAADVPHTELTHPTVRYIRAHALVDVYFERNFKWGQEPACREARAHVNEPFRCGASRRVLTMLHHCAMGSFSPGMCDAGSLLDVGAALEARCSQGDTALLACARDFPLQPETSFSETMKLLVERGADVRALSQRELIQHDGVVPTRETALGLVLTRELRYPRPRGSPAHAATQRTSRAVAALLRARGARLSDGDFWAIWGDRRRRQERAVLDRPFGAALRVDNAWSFPPAFFRAARLLVANVGLRDGPLGRGLAHETALVERVFAFLGRGDIRDFEPRASVTRAS